MHSVDFLHGARSKRVTGAAVNPQEGSPMICVRPDLKFLLLHAPHECRATAPPSSGTGGVNAVANPLTD